MFREEPQSCQFNLKLFQSIRHFTEFSKYRIGTIRKNGAGMTGKLCHIPNVFYCPRPPGVLRNNLFHRRQKWIHCESNSRSVHHINNPTPTNVGVKMLMITFRPIEGMSF